MPSACVRAAALAAAAAVVGGATGQERIERFDREPAWEGRNNRSDAFAPREIRQDFGYSAKARAVGGFITPAGEPAYYARRISRRTLADTLSASGTLRVADGPLNVLIGFFNSRTVNEWRTPNSIAIRILGRGDRFFAYVEYCTSRWRAGADSPGGFATVTDPETGRNQLRGFKSGGEQHRWSLRYDPQGEGGRGVVTVSIDNETAVCHLSEGHKEDGALFDRFGLLNVVKSADGGGELWLDDVEVLGEAASFDQDPGWEGSGNRRMYVSAIVRPRFDFGFSPTRFAGGKAAGELGGLVFRGDCRETERMAAYGDRVGPLTLWAPLRASGRICLRRGVSDSTTLLGFYDSQASLRRSESQKDSLPESFLGMAIEGPSSVGFLVRPVARPMGADGQWSPASAATRILPDGRSHTWSLEYSPPQGESPGRIVVHLDNLRDELTLRRLEEGDPTRFDRFGIVTTWIDGNGQVIYFDDLTYTISQAGR